jgi:hypothetical protein
MAKLSAFVAMYNDLMLAPSGLSKLEREMIAVAVSAHNGCYYCLVAHGAGVRGAFRRSCARRADGDELPRPARLAPRERAMLDFAVKLSGEPWCVDDGIARLCAGPASPTATSGTLPPSLASSTCPTGLLPPPTCGRTASITVRPGDVYQVTCVMTGRVYLPIMPFSNHRGGDRPCVQPLRAS